MAVPSEKEMISARTSGRALSTGYNGMYWILDTIGQWIPGRKKALFL